MSGDQAVSKFGSGCNCSQAVLEAYGPKYGLSIDDCHRISSGFGGGMRCGEVCGAVTGAYMVLGLKYGPQKEGDVSKETVNSKIIEFTGKFEKRHGSIRCKELLDCDIGTPEGMQTAKEGNLFKTICPEMVQAASDILEEQL